MSLVEKMSISGIRSFGQGNKEKQEIHFSSPVTLILGANGCGKTTIIECLKYGLTGEVPPGTNRGKSFVHDPKVSKSTESLGQIKLQVRNIRGQHLIITRSLKTFMQNNDLKFKIMNNNIEVTDPDGTKHSSGNRCVDVTAEMCNAMGVSKSIINNVLFCHQEDSNWPLDEPKKLKEKFDAIFGTTEYNRAIDKIIKQRKTLMEELKLKEGDLRIAQIMKVETEKKQLSLANNESKFSKLEEQSAEYEIELDPILQRLKNIEVKEGQLSRLYGRQIELSTKVDGCKNQQEALRKNIKELFTGSSDLLNIEIRSFKSDMNMWRNEMTEHNDEVKQLKETEKRILHQLTDLERKRTSLILERQQEQDLLADRAEKLKDLCTKLSISANSQDLETNSQSVFDIKTEIKNRERQEDRQLKEMSKSHDETEKEQQKEIDKIREEKASVENEISSKRRQITNLEKEKTEKEKSIKEKEKKEHQKKQVADALKSCNETYDNLSRTVNLVELKASVTAKKSNRDQLQEKLEKVDEEITFLNSIAKLSVEITSKEEQLKKNENEMKRIKAKHSDKFKLIFQGKTVESNFKREVETVRAAVQKTKKELEESIKSHDKNASKFSTIRALCLDELKRLKKELSDGEEKIYQLCKSVPFHECLTRTKERIDKLQGESTGVFFNHF